MSGRKLLAETTTPDGERLTLTLEAGEHVVRVRGELLMSSRVHGSEAAMAQYALGDRQLTSGARVLIGGLGLGYTLRAVLDLIPHDASVEVLELFAEVVEWNQGILGHYANHPLSDPRVSIRVAELSQILSESSEPFDSIVLDIDNGPEAFTVASNAEHYSLAGLMTLFNALVSGGTLVLWSSFNSRPFARRLNDVGFKARVEAVRAHGANRGRRHYLFVAERP